MTGGLLILGYAALTEGGVRNALLIPPMLGVIGYLDFVVAVKLIWPPEIEVSLGGLRWVNHTMRGSGNYTWAELDGPSQVYAGHGVSLLQMTVMATGRTLKYPPSHFGATYAEMAAVIEAAQAGRLLDPQQWRRDHPPHPFRDWALDWGLPILGAIGVAWVMRWLGH